ncbi:unnamed protein product, partial [marine sediment metagenome]
SLLASRKAYQEEHRQTHKEEISARSKVFREANRDKINA